MRSGDGRDSGRVNEIPLGGVMAGSRVAMMVTDPTAPDNPITYVNTAFERLTLYRRDDVIGRNWRFLHGENTEPADIERVRKGFDSGEDFVVTLNSHRADGSPFRNQLFVTPVNDETGTLTGYFGMLRWVDAQDAALSDPRTISSETMLKELQHRVKNHLAMVVSMIRLQSRREITAASFDDLSHRVEALSLFYDELFQAGERSAGQVPEAVEVCPYLQRVADAVTGLEGRSGLALELRCEDVALPVDTAARLGLLLSEFLTNAFKHAFAGRDAGTIRIDLTRQPDERICLSVADDGIGLPAGSTWPAGGKSIVEQHEDSASGAGPMDTRGKEGASGLGGSIVDGLARSIGAEVVATSEGSGTRFEVRVPAGEMPESSASAG
jgi:PAS domain S-box-containing protein